PAVPFGQHLPLEVQLGAVVFRAVGGDEVEAPFDIPGQPELELGAGTWLVEHRVRAAELRGPVLGAEGELAGRHGVGRRDAGESGAPRGGSRGWRGDGAARPTPARPGSSRALPGGASQLPSSRITRRGPRRKKSRRPSSSSTRAWSSASSGLGCAV